MKKQLLFAVLAVFLASCEEKGPFIDFSTAINTDTTYVAAVETPQERRILIEEFTGVTCPNCPAAHKEIKNLETNYPNRIIAIGYYPTNNPQTRPVVEPNGDTVSRQDFRSVKAEDLSKNFFGTSGNLPIGSVDRTMNGSALAYARTLWSGQVQQQSLKPSRANIHIKSSYDDAKREAVVTVKTAFTQDIAKKLLLTMVVVENNIIDAQEDNSSGSKAVIHDYVHNHVMREIYTFTEGSPILDSLSTKEAGRVYERVFIFNIPDTWAPENCKVVAFVSSAAAEEKEVLQAAEEKLKP